METRVIVCRPRASSRPPLGSCFRGNDVTVEEVSDKR